eukprot:gene7334-5168_t
MISLLDGPHHSQPRQGTSPPPFAFEGLWNCLPSSYPTKQAEDNERASLEDTKLLVLSIFFSLNLFSCFLVQFIYLFIIIIIIIVIIYLCSFRFQLFVGIVLYMWYNARICSPIKARNRRELASCGSVTQACGGARAIVLWLLSLHRAAFCPFSIAFFLMPLVSVSCREYTQLKTNLSAFFGFLRVKHSINIHLIALVAHIRTTNSPSPRPLLKYFSTYRTNSDPGDDSPSTPRIPEGDHHQEEGPHSASSFHRDDSTPENSGPGSGDLVEEGTIPFDRRVSEPAEAEFIRQANACVIHLTRPIENLPSIGPEELKVIGRCITFEAETLFQGEIRRMHYSGLVSSICFDTVSLINVTRFSEKSFETFMRKKAAKDLKDAAAGKSGQGEEMTGNSDEFEKHTPILAHGSETTEDISRGPQQISEETPDTVIVKDESQSSYVYRMIASTGKRLLREFDEDFAAPFMTFSRKKIHNVQFSIDPPSSFYSLFRKPEKHFFDMQCLRMFARRYIVHTSQGNNPRNVPLKAFIVCRCNCPHIEDELLVRVTREEIVYLFKLDAEIKRMNVRVQRLVEEVEQTEAISDLEMHHMLLIRRFAHDTILIGVIELFFVCLLLLIRYGLWTEVAFLSPFLHKFKISTFFFWVSMCVLGFITSVHGRVINPYGSAPSILKILRIILCIASIYWCCLVLVTGTNDLAGSKLRRFFQTAAASSSQLRHFYDSYACSGFHTSCPDMTTVDQTLCPRPESGTAFFYDEPCAPIIHGIIHRTVTPVFLSASSEKFSAEAKLSVGRLSLSIYVASIQILSAFFGAHVHVITAYPLWYSRIPVTRLFVFHYPFPRWWVLYLVLGRLVQYCAGHRVTDTFQQRKTQTQIMMTATVQYTEIKFVVYCGLPTPFSSSCWCLTLQKSPPPSLPTPYCYISLSDFRFLFLFLLWITLRLVRVVMMTTTPSLASKPERNVEVNFAEVEPEHSGEHRENTHEGRQREVVAQERDAEGDNDSERANYDHAEHELLINVSSLAIQEKLTRCVIHADRVIEDLPTIKSVELGSIGRCVALFSKTTTAAAEEGESMAYVGMVSSVTPDTLTLLHCQRYTAEEFEVRHRQHFEHHPPDLDSNPFTDMNMSRTGEAVVTRFVSEDFSTHPLITFSGPADVEKLRVDCTMGPLPCVSFSRKKIFDIKFGLNPPSTFYSLFFNPSKKVTDMQYLRMFVRRYLVHTSQGNNSNLIPLRAFILCSCNCSAVDDTLLERVAQEELHKLLHVDAKIEAKRRVRLGRQHGLRTLEGPNVLQEVLTSMGIPRLSLVMGLTELFCAVFIFFFLLGCYCFSSQHIRKFMRDNWTFLFGNPLVVCASAALVIRHSKAMVLPFRSQLFISALRVTLCVCVFAFLVLTGQVLTMFVVHDGIQKWVSRCDINNDFSEAQKQQLGDSLFRILVPGAILNFSLAMMVLFDLVVTDWTGFLPRVAPSSFDRGEYSYGNRAPLLLKRDLSLET